MHIRLATPADIPLIMKLERASATAGHWSEEQYQQAFEQESPGRLLLVAEEALSPVLQSSWSSSLACVGFLVARHVAPDWELENIVVDPSACRKGLGNWLLDALLAAARETNSEAVFLEVRESNSTARAFYEKAGFEQTGRRKSYYTKPAEDAILYRRPIEGDGSDQLNRSIRPFSE